MFSFDFEEFRQMDNYQKMILMISILTVMTAAGKTLVGAVSMIMNIIGPVSSAEYAASASAFVPGSCNRH